MKCTLAMDLFHDSRQVCLYITMQIKHVISQGPNKLLSAILGGFLLCLITFYTYAIVYVLW